MKATFSYDAAYEPPAPVLPFLAGAPDGSGPRVLLRALVDTGADITVVPSWLPRRLDLRAIDAVSVSTPTGAGRVPLVAVSVRVADAERTIHALALGEEPLVGRDLLGEWVLTLDGPATRLDLSLG